jgi:PII-like signaling protein
MTNEETHMKGWSLRFYLHENDRHRGTLLYEWLLEQAKAHGIQGGTVFRAIAGFGRHGMLTERHFFELAGQLTVLVEFLVSEREADALLDLVRADGASVFHARFPVEFGVIGEPDHAD